MGTIGENSTYWSSYDWKQGGDEWSEVWGGTLNLWGATLYPRIRNYIPVPAILEIAPGFGRFTQFLREFCQQLIIVDVTEKCIVACKERFADCDHISYHVNDGRALDMVGDRSVDFAFSFDSLVHVEADTIGAYLSGLGRKLKIDGIGFFHHSNIAALVDPTTGRLPFENRHWRGESVSADLVAQLCAEASLQCVVQEIVNWGCPQLTDCFTVFTPIGSRHALPLRRIENPAFMEEATHLGDLSRLYSLRQLASHVDAFPARS